ncbi:hypothetical protein KC324_g84 [Hortaea werneckii]|nr:hypothetical protein KC324_g84 [Hortaea werneckii]
MKHSSSAYHHRISYNVAYNARQYKGVTVGAWLVSYHMLGKSEMPRIRESIWRGWFDCSTLNNERNAGILTDYHAMRECQKILQSQTSATQKNCSQPVLTLNLHNLRVALGVQHQRSQLATLNTPGVKAFAPPM